MKRFVTPAAALVAVIASGAMATLAGAEHGGSARPDHIPPGGIHWARGVAPARRSSSPNLVNHGGPVMTQGAYVEPIFWGARWNDRTFAADKISGIETFYKGVGSSSYEATDTEYTQSNGLHVGTSVTFGGSHTDFSTAPKSGNRTSTILAEACRAATNLMPSGFYPVYVDSPRGNAGYCAWHSAGTCSNGVTVQFAFFFNLDGDAGCDPQDASGLHSEGLAALANVSGHELSEALTDPHLDAWYDASGAENSDKCAWAFGTPLLGFSNGSKWKIQGNWSNAAYDKKSGYPNRDGQSGCLDGGNFK
jgi:hypothetical protein